MLTNNIKEKYPFLIFNTLILLSFLFIVSRSITILVNTFVIVIAPFFILKYRNYYKKLFKNKIALLFFSFVFLLLCFLLFALFKNNLLFNLKYFYLTIITTLAFSFIVITIPLLGYSQFSQKINISLVLLFLFNSLISIYTYHAYNLPYSSGLLGITSLYGKALSIIFPIILTITIYSLYQYKKVISFIVIFLLPIYFIFFIQDTNLNSSRTLFLIFSTNILLLLLIYSFLNKKIMSIILILSIIILPFLSKNIWKKINKSNYIYLSQKVNPHYNISFKKNKLLLYLPPKKQHLINCTLFNQDGTKKNYTNIKTNKSIIKLNFNSTNQKNYNVLSCTYKLINQSNSSFHEIYYHIPPLKNSFKYKKIYETNQYNFNLSEINIHNFYKIKISNLKYQRKHIWLSTYSIAKRSIKEKSGLFFFKKDFYDPEKNDFAPIIMNMNDNSHYHPHNNFLFLYSESHIVLAVLFLVLSFILFILPLSILIRYSIYLKNNKSKLPKDLYKKGIFFILFYYCFLSIYINQQIYGLVDLTLFSTPTDIIFWISMGYLLKLSIQKNIFYSIFKKNEK